MPQKLPPIDAEKILRELDAIRRQIPDLEAATEARARSENASDAYVTDALSHVSGEAAEELMTEFDYLAVERTLQELHEDLGAEIMRKRQLVHDQCLEIYYKAVELVEQGDASLIPAVEAMEQAYRQDYGRDIPPKTRHRQ